MGWIYTETSSQADGYEQRRVPALGAGRLLEHVDCESLSLDERDELIELWAQVAEPSKDITSLEHASA